MFSVAVEAAFPQCAIIRLGDWYIEHNREQLASLQDASLYDSYGIWCGKLVAGSRAEGLAIEMEWGHPEVDEDIMELYGGPLGVHVPQGHQPPGRAVLRYIPEGCPAAYCKIEVTDVPALTRIQVGLNGECLNESCVHNSEGVDWLKTFDFLIQLLAHCSRTIGPAGQRHDGTSEDVPTLVCSSHHPDMDQNFDQRPRQGWPSTEQLEAIKQLRMVLVLTGYKLSLLDEIQLQARLSWSPSEMVLLIDLPQNIRQVYIAVKYVFKYFMTTRQDPNITLCGRSKVGSYHLKTVFLHHLERKPPSIIRSQLDLMIGLLHDLDGYLQAGNLPHYFLPDSNLLSTVGSEERHTAHDVIRNILSDPLRAILTCPTDPEHIYGKVKNHKLVAAFCQVSSNPTCLRSRGDLLQLLGCLDETRRERYREQQETDNRFKVSGRPQLRGLVDMLCQQIQQH